MTYGSNCIFKGPHVEYGHRQMLQSAWSHDADSRMCCIMHSILGEPFVCFYHLCVVINEWKRGGFVPWMVVGRENCQASRRGYRGAG